jgi:hypothetical protein
MEVSLEQARQQITVGVKRITEMPADCFDQRASAAFGVFAAGINKVCESDDGFLHEAIEHNPSTVEEKRLILSFLVSLHERKELYQKQVNMLIWQLLQNPSWRSAGLDGPDDICSLVKERMIAGQVSELVGDLSCAQEMPLYESDSVATPPATISEPESTPTNGMEDRIQLLKWTTESLTAASRELRNDLTTLKKSVEGLKSSMITKMEHVVQDVLRGGGNHGKDDEYIRERVATVERKIEDLSHTTAAHLKKATVGVAPSMIDAVDGDLLARLEALERRVPRHAQEEDLKAALVRLEDVENRIEVWKGCSISGWGKVYEDIAKKIEGVQSQTDTLAQQVEDDKTFRDQHTSWLETRLGHMLDSRAGDFVNDLDFKEYFTNLEKELRKDITEQHQAHRAHLQQLDDIIEVERRSSRAKIDETAFRIDAIEKSCKLISLADADQEANKISMAFDDVDITAPAGLTSKVRSTSAEVQFGQSLSSSAEAPPMVTPRPLHGSLHHPQADGPNHSLRSSYSHVAMRGASLGRMASSQALSCRSPEAGWRTTSPEMDSSTMPVSRLSVRGASVSILPNTPVPGNRVLTAPRTSLEPRMLAPMSARQLSPMSARHSTPRSNQFRELRVKPAVSHSNASVSPSPAMQVREISSRVCVPVMGE